MEHTTDPWAMVEDENGDNFIRCGDHNTLFIGNIESICGECLHNGKLATAAPALLNACRSARAVVEVQMRQWKRGLIGMVCQCAYCEQTGVSASSIGHTKDCLGKSLLNQLDAAIDEATKL